MPGREILDLNGEREHDIEIAKRVKEQLYTYLPEMAALREQLIAAGMMDNNFSSVTRVVTPEILFNRLRTDPNRYLRLSQQHTPLPKEVYDELQDIAREKARATRLVPDSRPRHRRR